MTKELIIAVHTRPQLTSIYLQVLQAFWFSRQMCVHFPAAAALDGDGGVWADSCVYKGAAKAESDTVKVW